MNQIARPKHIPNITSIRFIFCILVILIHVAEFSRNRDFPFFNDLSIYKRGTDAVYMFFTLSGFLIIKQLYDEKRYTGTIHLKRFYLKRVLRIVPLYYLVLVIGFLYYQLILPSFGFEFESNYNLLSGIILSLTFFPNIFATYSPGGILEILWSIGIEVQFYFVIAPLFLLLPLKRMVLFLGVFTVVYFFIFYSNFGPILIKYKMMYFYFSIGGICSIMMRYPLFQTFVRKLKYPVLLIFVVYFITSIFDSHLNDMLYTLFSILLLGMFLSVLSQKPIKILENKPMNYLGNISYGMYVYHAIVLQFVGLLYLKVLSNFNLPKVLDIIILNLLTIVITIIVSHFSYKYFESYFMKLRRKRL